MYIAKARSTDQQYCGSAQGTTGPVETCLASLGDVKGLVVGAFGEGSEDLHALIHHLATSRVKRLGPKREREVSEDGGGRAGHHHLLPEEDLKLQF